MAVVNTDSFRSIAGLREVRNEHPKPINARGNQDTRRFAGKRRRELLDLIYKHAPKEFLENFDEGSTPASDDRAAHDLVGICETLAMQGHIPAVLPVGETVGNIEDRLTQAIKRIKELERLEEQNRIEKTQSSAKDNGHRLSTATDNDEVTALSWNDLRAKAKDQGIDVSPGRSRSDIEADLRAD